MWQCLETINLSKVDYCSCHICAVLSLVFEYILFYGLVSVTMIIMDEAVKFKKKFISWNVQKKILAIAIFLQK